MIKMKKYLMYSVLVVVFSLVLVSCSIPYDQPYGKWKANVPELAIDILLDIDPEKEAPYKGVLLKNGEIFELLISFGFEQAFEMRDANGLDGSDINRLNAYFSGNFKVKKDKIYYKLKPHWQERHGIDEIVFEKIEDYGAE